MYSLLLLITASVQASVEATVQSATFSKLCSSGPEVDPQTPSHRLHPAAHLRFRCLGECGRDEGCSGTAVIQGSSTAGSCAAIQDGGSLDCAGYPVDTAVMVYGKNEEEEVSRECAPTSIYVAEFNSCYELFQVNSAVDFAGAKDTCTSLGAHYHLVAITTSAEQGYLANMLVQSPLDCNLVWTAGYAHRLGDPSPTAWYWDLGYTTLEMEAVQVDGFMPWGDDEPNNSSGDQYFLMLNSYTGYQWTDLGNTFPEWCSVLCALCEMGK